MRDGKAEEVLAPEASIHRCAPQAIALLVEVLAAQRFVGRSVGVSEHDEDASPSVVDDAGLTRDFEVRDGDIEASVGRPIGAGDRGSHEEHNEAGRFHVKAFRDR